MSQRIAVCGADAHRAAMRDTSGKAEEKSNDNDKIILAGLESTSPDISCVYSLKCSEGLVFLRLFYFLFYARFPWRPVDVNCGWPVTRGVWKPSCLLDICSVSVK